MTKYWNSIKNSDKVFYFHMYVGFQMRKNVRNIKGLTKIKIGILSRITLNFTKEDFYGVIGFFMV